MRMVSVPTVMYASIFNSYSCFATHGTLYNGSFSTTFTSIILLQIAEYMYCFVPLRVLPVTWEANEINLPPRRSEWGMMRSNMTPAEADPNRSLMSCFLEWGSTQKPRRVRTGCAFRTAVPGDAQNRMNTHLDVMYLVLEIRISLNQIGEQRCSQKLIRSWCSSLLYFRP